MANPDHLAILKQALDKKDISIWNNWRKEEDPDIRLDLIEANLAAANLAEADLTEVDLVGAHLRGARLEMASLVEASLVGADLTETDLWKADLSGAHLERANLHRANLQGGDLEDADLWKANLMEANLEEVYLKNADLSQADLSRAILSQADLNGANFSYAICTGTIFANVDLSQVLNLDKVEHKGPSTIGIDTLIKSKGKIPIEFLEGVGLPKHTIANLPYIVDIPTIQFYSCFISYNSQNEDFCKQLAARMKDNGLRVWFAPDDIKAGKKIHEQVYEAIRYHDKLIIVLSEHSMNSNWVETEIRRARKRERDEGRRVLFPIRLVDYEALQDWQLFDADEGRDLAQEIREYFIPDFQNWKDYDQFTIAFDRLLADLQKDE